MVCRDYVSRLFQSRRDHQHWNPFSQGRLLLQAQKLVAMNRPSMRDQLSVRNFMENRPCLTEEEASFIYEKEDLVTLRPGRDFSAVDAFVERMLKIFHCRLLQVKDGSILVIRTIRLTTFSLFSAQRWVPYFKSYCRGQWNDDWVLREFPGDCL